MTVPVLVWFRRDLRTADHPALATAAAEGRPVVPVCLPDEPAHAPPGAAARWWRDRALAALAGDLAALGAFLVVRPGPAAEGLPALAAETGADSVFWNDSVTPGAAAADAETAAALDRAGVRVRRFAHEWPADPGRPRTKGGTPFRVFTPYWRALERAGPPPGPVARPAALRPGPRPDGAPLPAAPPPPDMAPEATWQPDPTGARAALEDAAVRVLPDYAATRDRPDRDGTSGLSPCLAAGNLSAATVWHAVEGTAGAAAFRRELGWRGFCYHLLWQHPGLADTPWKPEFAAFPWRDDAAAVAAWCAGRTGFPFIDAGMRQLRATGWMHNRARMATASFLVKDLLIPWQEGERWFRERLVDADPASNAANWQWVAGCGADAAPYFRIFNPVTQGQRFDPDGTYVRRWVPELRDLPATTVHTPWKAPPTGYPAPLVDHKAARQRALEAFRSLRE